MWPNLCKSVLWSKHHNMSVDIFAFSKFITILVLKTVFLFRPLFYILLLFICIKCWTFFSKNGPKSYFNFIIFPITKLGLSVS